MHTPEMGEDPETQVPIDTDPSHEVALHDDPEHVINQLLHGLRETAEEVVPWFLSHMPKMYFQDTSSATQLSHLRSDPGRFDPFSRSRVHSCVGPRLCSGWASVSCVARSAMFDRRRWAARNGFDTHSG